MYTLVHAAVFRQLGTRITLPIFHLHQITFRSTFTALKCVPNVRQNGYHPAVSTDLYGYATPDLLLRFQTFNCRKCEYEIYVIENAFFKLKIRKLYCFEYFINNYDV